MANNLIKNETNVFYTVKTNEGLVVSEARIYGGRVENVQVSRSDQDASRYNSKKTAQEISQYIEGQLIRHTRTEVITETTEKIEGENK